MENTSSSKSQQDQAVGVPDDAPRTWKIVMVPEEPEDGDFTGCDAHIRLVDGSGEDIIGADDSHGCCDYRGKTWPVISAYHARLIVRAVNAHDALVEALAKLTFALRCDTADIPHSTDARFNLLAESEAALKLARG